MGSRRSPSELVAKSDGLLLDFDGPVCNVYAGADPASVAADIRAKFDLNTETDDPLDLITYALNIDGPVDAIHEALTQAELRAVATATETPGVRQLIETYPGPIAIVSNNAAEAIEEWLRLTGIRHHIDVVTGRRVRQMKPDPSTLIESTAALECNLDRCVFIGDSLSDAEAARQAGTIFIALANKPGKRETFHADGCTSIVDTMAQLSQYQTQSSTETT